MHELSWRGPGACTERAQSVHGRALLTHSCPLWGGGYPDIGGGAGVVGGAGILSTIYDLI